MLEQFATANNRYYRMCSVTVENVFCYYRMCSLTTNDLLRLTTGIPDICVLLLQNVFSNNRMCSLTIEQFALANSRYS